MVRVRYVVCENHVQEGIISEIDNDECLGDNIFQKSFFTAAAAYNTDNLCTKKRKFFIF